MVALLFVIPDEVNCSAREYTLGYLIRNPGIDTQGHWTPDQVRGDNTKKHDGKTNIGLPLGKLTSQLLVNIYMNEFDQYMKHTLKTEYYIRYADDFVILSHDKQYLENTRISINTFLREKLNLTLHPDKVFIKTYASGVDFLGWVHFPHHRVLRTATKKRMFKKLKETQKKEVEDSYRGMLGHGDSYKLKNKLDFGSSSRRF